MTTKLYKKLKTDLLAPLSQQKSTLYHLIEQKKCNQKTTNKNVMISILKRHNRAVSLYDIVSDLVARDLTVQHYDLILGERVSSSKKAIISGRDSCLSCQKDTPCARKLATMSSKERLNYLLYLRLIRAKKMLSAMKWSCSAVCFKGLLDEPLLLKFIVSYALVVDIKNELKKEGEIADHKTLYKGSGKYCPYDDLWELS